MVVDGVAGTSVKHSFVPSGLKFANSTQKSPIGKMPMFKVWMGSEYKEYDRTRSVELAKEFLGLNRVVNGDFSNGTTGWTAMTVTDGVGSTDGGEGFQVITVKAGKVYDFSCICDRQGASPSIAIKADSTTGSSLLVFNPVVTGGALYTGQFTATSNTAVIHLDNANDAALFDTFSIKEVTYSTGSQLSSYFTFNSAGRLLSYTYTDGDSKAILEDDTASADGYMIIDMKTVVGKKYVVSVIPDVVSIPTQSYYRNRILLSGAQTQISNPGLVAKQEYTFVAEETTTPLYLYTDGKLITYEQLSLRELYV